MEGLCARCLGALNFAPETVLPGEHAAHAPALTPEELAPHFPQLEIIACLGRGGMGVVYKARQKSLNRLVALKLLAPERANDPQFATRFEKEAQALASLNHPHIVGVYDFGQAGGFFYLLMEFVDGVNLRQAMSAGRFTPEQSLAIVPPVCEALQYAHEHGIVHRDIKPENLLLDKEGRVKIADFGIAKMLGTEADTSARDDEQQAGTLASAAGTPQYMAPEQKAHRTTDHRADIYSLGVVLYELLTGELPTDKLQPPSRKVQIDVRLDEIVLRALQTQPELRYQTAREFRTQLETVVSTHADSQSSCLFKTGQGFLYPPDQFTTASGQLYAYRMRGQLILDDRHLTHVCAGANTIIPLTTIRDVSIAGYPRTLFQPTGVDILSVTYEEGGERTQILLSPMEGWFGFPSDRNALTAEWFAALRDAVTSATGRKPASTPREQVGIPSGSHLTLSLLLAGPWFALAVLWGCLIYIAIMRQMPGALTTFPFNINPLGVVFAMLLLYGLIAGGLPWLGHRRARNARASAASPDALCSSPGSIAARPQFSRTAIVGACLVVMGLLSLFLSFFVDQMATRPTAQDGIRSLHTPATAAPAMLGAMLVYAFFATLLGWISVTQIRRSAGKLDGLWLAVFDGLFFPLLALDALILSASGAIIWLLRSSDSGMMPVWLMLFLTGLGVFTVVLIGWVDTIIVRAVWQAVNRTQTDCVAVRGPVTPHWKKIALACIAIYLLIFWFFGVHSVSVQWSGEGPQDVARELLKQSSQGPTLPTPAISEPADETETPKPENAGMRPAHNSITPIRWSGPQGTVLSIEGMKLKIGSGPAHYGVPRDDEEIRHLNLIVESPPLLQDAVLFGRLDVYPCDAATAKFLQGNPVPLAFTKEDLRAAWDDGFVEVFYLPHPKPGDESPSPVEIVQSTDVEIVDSTHGDPQGDKRAVDKARQSGQILAVLRLGNDFKPTDVKVKVESPPTEPARLRVRNSDGSQALFNSVVEAKVGYPNSRLPNWCEDPTREGIVSLEKLPVGTHWLVAAAEFSSRLPFQITIPTEQPLVERRLRAVSWSSSTPKFEIGRQAAVELHDKEGEFVVVEILNQSTDPLNLSELDVELLSEFESESIRGLSPKWLIADREPFPPIKIEAGQTGRMRLNWREWARKGLWSSRNREVMAEPGFPPAEPGKVWVKAKLGSGSSLPVAVTDPKIMLAEALRRRDSDRQQLQGRWRLNNEEQWGAVPTNVMSDGGPFVSPIVYFTPIRAVPTYVVEVGEGTVPRVIDVHVIRP